MSHRSLLVRIASVGAALLIGATAASAQTFVGSWRVDQGPWWSGQPTPQVLSGQEAAALLFGGSPSDYFISTMGSDVSAIDHLSWYSVIYVGGGKFAEGYHNDLNGNGLYDLSGDASAYVADNLSGEQYTNYAFRVATTTTPEPASLALLGTGLVGIGGLTWRRRKVAG